MNIQSMNYVLVRHGATRSEPAGFQGNAPYRACLRTVFRSGLRRVAKCRPLPCLVCFRASRVESGFDSDPGPDLGQAPIPIPTPDHPPPNSIPRPSPDQLPPTPAPDQPPTLTLARPRPLLGPILPSRPVCRIRCASARCCDILLAKHFSMIKCRRESTRKRFKKARVEK